MKIDLLSMDASAKCPINENACAILSDKYC